MVRQRDIPTLMPINSSTFVQGLAQVDGRRQVTEKHVDHMNVAHIYSWLAAEGVDPTPVVAGRVAGLLAQLKDNEIERNLAVIKNDGQLAVTVLNYSTIDENFSVVRAYYLTATRVEAIFIGDFMSARTNAQLQSLFGMNNTQVNNLRTNKLTPAATAAATIRATTGA
jgi:hypothetical protein